MNISKDSSVKPVSELKIQIRKLKSISPQGSMETKAINIPLDVGTTFDSVGSVLKTPWQELYAKAEITDKKDLFFTLGYANSDTELERVWLAQKVILFDCDGADKSRTAEYLRIFSEVTHLPQSYFAATWTGGGIHIIVALKTPIETKKFFKDFSIHYQIILQNLKAACEKLKLPATWDPNVFAPHFMSRLPGSINSKYENGEVKLLQDSLIDVDFDLSKVSGMPNVPSKELLSKKELSYFRIDSPSVETGCDFLKYSKEHAKTLSEPEWFASLSILARLQNGKQLAHEYSKAHHNYSEQTTDQKLNHVLKSGMGPRTCESIEAMFPGCTSCPNYKKVKSPIQIKGDKFIASRESGFAIPRVGSNGNISSIAYQYRDLMLHFEQENPFVFVPEKKENGLAVWNGKHWQERNKFELLEYAQTHFKPFISSNHAQEFWNLLNRSNVKRFEEFFDSPEQIGKINLQNGVFDVDTQTLLPHNPDLGFRTVLDYEYDPSAKAPLFEKFLSDLTCQDAGIEAILQEWLGYTISGCRPLAQKMLIATGEGQNGKSKLFEVVFSAVVGYNRVASPTFETLKDKNTIAETAGKDLCYFDEVPEAGKKATWEFLKSLSTGTKLTGSYKYENAFSFFFRAKIVMSCNKLPYGTDPSHGYFRRLIIIPFNARFSDDDGSKDSSIAERIVASELSGILNWAVAGYIRLKANDWNFSSSTTVNNALEDYKISVDPIGTFIKENLELGAQQAGHLNLTCELLGEHWINLQELYSLFIAEQEQGNRGTQSFTTFLGRVRAFVEGASKGRWVKVSGSDKRWEICGHLEGSKWPQHVVLERKRVDYSRIYVMRGVKLRGIAAPPQF